MHDRAEPPLPSVIPATPVIRAELDRTETAADLLRRLLRLALRRDRESALLAERREGVRP